LFGLSGAIAQKRGGTLKEFNPKNRITDLFKNQKTPEMAISEAWPLNAAGE
jgi:hypothetical protein